MNVTGITDLNPSQFLFLENLDIREQRKMLINLNLVLNLTNILASVKSVAKIHISMNLTSHPFQFAM